MSKLVLPAEYMAPVIVTYAELKAKLWPHIWGYKWAEDTIRDLWLLSIPVPDAGIGEEKRILHPGAFRKWWADVCQRQSLDLQVNEVFSRKVKVL